jgi:hypothetical protein
MSIQLPGEALTHKSIPEDPLCTVDGLQSPGHRILANHKLRTIVEPIFQADITAAPGAADSEASSPWIEHPL